MPVVRIGTHTIRVDESEKLNSTETSAPSRGISLEDAKAYRNQSDKYSTLYTGTRLEKIRMARIRQKARKKGQDFRITWEEWQQFLKDNHVEDLKGVEIRIIDTTKPFTVSNLQVVGL